MTTDNFKLFLLPLFIALVTLGEPAASAQTRRDQTRRPPILGADLTWADFPHPLIAGWEDKQRGDEMAEAFKSAGLRSLRFNFSGIYSPRSPKATAKIKAENKTTNEFPWFPFDQYVEFIASHDLTTVVGINVEEGPDVAEEVVRTFMNRRAKKKLVAIELSNEPHLNYRPWLPEEYAARAAEVIERLTPLGVRFALPLTVGKERHTPTKLSDDEWNSRMMRTLAPRIGLKDRTDVYGVLHLYSDGVRAKSLDYFDKAIRPFAPGMRYLVTEFNIRLGLERNQQLTNSYAMEFARKLAELMAAPGIEAMYVHSVPYHSIMYWANGKRIATVSSQHDARLKGDDLSRGWHSTPAGRVYRLYSELSWNGEIIAFGGSDNQKYWAVRGANGRVVATLLNDTGNAEKRRVKIEGRELVLSAPSRSIVCFDVTGAEIEHLVLN